PADRAVRHDPRGGHRPAAAARRPLERLGGRHRLRGAARPRRSPRGPRSGGRAGRPPRGPGPGGRAAPPAARRRGRRDRPSRAGRGGRPAVDGPLQPARLRRRGGPPGVPGGPLTKRDARHTPLACALTLVAAVARIPSARADDWPQFRGDPHLTGVARSVPPERLDVIWTQEAGGSVGSSAAIVDGVVYVGSESGALLALDLATGARKWTYATGAEIGESSP